MRPLFGVWKIIFTRSTAIWKKREKESKKIKVAFLDFLGLQWLPGFQAFIVLIFQGIQAKKTPQKYWKREFGG